MEGKIVITSEGEIMVTSLSETGLPLYLPAYPNEILNTVMNGDGVEFKVIDEFTNPELYSKYSLFDGPTFAKVEKIIKYE